MRAHISRGISKMYVCECIESCNVLYSGAFAKQCHVIIFQYPCMYIILPFFGKYSRLYLSIVQTMHSQLTDNTYALY